VIPAGLFAIGLGFIMMKFGTSTAHASWLTMLPGCVLAGAGLGLINTPVTNTTTGSVPSARAGMASGIDMSARLITLAINIALMGTILVKFGIGMVLLYGAIAVWACAALSLMIFQPVVSRRTFDKDAGRAAEIDPRTLSRHLGTSGNTADGRASVVLALPGETAHLCTARADGQRHDGGK